MRNVANLSKLTIHQRTKMGKPRGKTKRYSINPKLYNRKEVEELKDKDYEIEQRIKMLEYQMEKLKGVIRF